jgi:RNA polymerase sigma-70 factor (ECF subfamily)
MRSGSGALVRTSEQATCDDLVARAREGDQSAVAALYERHFESVRRSLRAKLMPCDRDDVAQQAFLRAITSLARFDPTRSSFRTWLLAIAANLARDRHRATARNRAMDPDDVRREIEASCGDAFGAEEAMIATEGFGELVGRLAPEQRDVLTLRFVHDWSTDRIGLACGRSADAIAHAQSRGLARLRRLVSALDAAERRAPSGEAAPPGRRPRLERGAVAVRHPRERQPAPVHRLSER